MPDKDYHKMIGQIDKYWDKLFADPITVNTSSGQLNIQPQRTNNILDFLIYRGARRDRREQ
jgi:hypothetical protein